MSNMNWNHDERMAAIGFIAFKLMSEQNPFQRIRGLTVIRNLTWQTSVQLNSSRNDLSNWLTPEELQKIKIS